MKRSLLILLAVLLFVISGCKKEISQDDKLLIAVKEGNYLMAEEALTLGADIDGISPRLGNKKRPLEIAMVLDNWDYAIWLLELGAKPQSDDGFNGINVAVVNGPIRLIEAFISRGAKVDNSTLNQYLLAGGHDYDKTLFLIENGALVTEEIWLNYCKKHIFSKDQDFPYKQNKLLLSHYRAYHEDSGLNPMVEAAALGENALLQAELAKASLTKEEQVEVLFNVVAFCELEVLELCYELNWNLKANDQGKNNLLHQGATFGRQEMVTYLIDQGVDLNHLNLVNASPLIDAIDFGENDIATTLLKRGARLLWDGNKDQLTKSVNELQSAVRLDNSEILKAIEQYAGNYDRSILQELLKLAAINNAEMVTKFIIDEGASVNLVDSNNLVPIELAARHGSLEVVRTLLNHGAFIEFDYTIAPLFEAVSHNQNQVASFLLEKGASPDVTTTNETPLWKAITLGNLYLIEELIEAGADISISRVLEGESYLHLSAKLGSSRLVTVLMEAGATIDCQDHRGRTPLMIAIEEMHLGVTETLMLYEPNLSLLNDQGKSALDLVKEKNDSDLNKLVVN